MDKNAKKILIIGPAWVGDMVMAQVLFTFLKQQNFAVIIDVLAPDWSRALLERMPEVRRAIAMPLVHGQLGLKQRWQLGKNLRAERYDQAIVLPNSWKSALIPFAARISQRTGWCGEMRYGLLNDRRYLDKVALPFMVQRFLALGLPKHAILPTDFTKPKLKITSYSIENTLAKFNLTVKKPILALCPGAEFGAAKRWPAKHFAAIVAEKIKNNWQVWLFGSVKDQIVAHEIQQLTQHACVNLTGKTNLSEAIDLLSVASLVVTNDSGLMHVAAALQRAIVVLYGSSSPKFTPPLAEKIKILSLNLACSPCFQRECPLQHLKCLQDLSPNLVLQAMDELEMLL